MTGYLVCETLRRIMLLASILIEKVRVHRLPHGPILEKKSPGLFFSPSVIILLVV